MIVKKPKQTKKARFKRTKPMDWKEALRLHLSKVPTVDAVFVNEVTETIHVYSIVEDFEDESCAQLLKQEAKIEKTFPKLAFEFHTRAHQGRDPKSAGSWGSELVYLR